jgi:hypothetical protein
MDSAILDLIEEFRRQRAICLATTVTRAGTHSPNGTPDAVCLSRSESPAPWSRSIRNGMVANRRSWGIFVGRVPETSYMPASCLLPGRISDTRGGKRRHQSLTFLETRFIINS